MHHSYRRSARQGHHHSQVEEQVPQCGYCVNGWIMTAAALLNSNPNMTDEQIRAGLAGLKCRCGTHMSIMRAVKRARQMMSERV